MLLEAQFDENQKFKQILAQELADSNDLRSKPIGVDKDANVYWFLTDAHNSFRLFAQSGQDLTIWRLVAKLRQFCEKKILIT
jgi:hypothetical protein